MNPKLKTEVKICGLSTEDAVEAALAGGASHLGFIFFEKSPRNVTPQAAAKLSDKARGRAKIVAVTVDADDDRLDEIVSVLQPDVLQLHGHEDSDRVQALKARHGLPVIKAISLREPGDVEAAFDFAGAADRLLFDAKPPAGAQLPGGNGVAFDWGLLGGLDAEIDYMLSGGLNADNIASALAMTDARAVDVSSGVEKAPGIKDTTRIGAFFAALRAAENEPVRER